MLFVEAPQTREELARIVHGAARHVPLMANMVEGGKTPILSGRRARGARLRAGDLPRRHRARARPHRVGLLRRRSPRNGTTEPFRDRMFDFDGLNAIDRHARVMHSRSGKRYEDSE